MCTGAELPLIMAGMQAAGIAIGVGGAATQYVGASRQAAASKEAEGLRKQAMELESARKQREIVRQAQLQASTALNRTTAQTGSSAQGSSALPGAYGQIQQDAGRSLTYENAQLNIGRGIFDANAAYAGAGSLTAAGSAASTIGSALIKTSGPMQDMMESLFGGNRSSKVNGRYTSTPGGPGSGGAP